MKPCDDGREMKTREVEVAVTHPTNKLRRMLVV
jgi:hypothetical protein